MRGYRLLFGMMAWGTAVIVSAAPLTPAQQAFSDAQALANGAKTGAAASVSGGGVASTVNQFNPTYYNSNGAAPESALFQNGNGNTVSAGQTKVSNCQNDTPNPDPFLRQNCEAINLMVNNPSNRPTIAIPPSLFAASKTIEANPNTLAASSVGIADPNAVGAFTGCVNKTVGPPPTTEMCSEFKGTAAQQCTVGRVVVVDEFTDYKCDKTQDTYLPQTCDRTVQVTITQPSPTPATYLCPTGMTLVGSNCESYFGVSWIRSNSRSDCSGVWSAWVTGSTGLYCRQRGCPLGGTLSGLDCVNSVAVAYTCPPNTTLTGTGTSSTCIYPVVVTSSVNNGCLVQEAAALSTIAATVSYSCPSGSTISGSTCQPAPSTATANYSCGTGQTLSGTSCVTPAVNATLTYSCPSGSTLSGSTCQPAPSTATANYSCGTGQTLSGTSCVPPAVNATLTYSCPSGSTLSGSTCQPSPTPATYLCPTGMTLVGSNCESYFGVSWIRSNSRSDCSGVWSKWVTGSTGLYCRERGCPLGGTLSGLDCVNRVAVAYTCPTGDTLSGTSCIKSTFAATFGYTCPAGDTLSGTTCQSPATTAAITYSCPTGDTLSGTSCIKPTIAATISYTCPYGDALSGTTCQQGVAAP